MLSYICDVYYVNIYIYVYYYIHICLVCYIQKVYIAYPWLSKKKTSAGPKGSHLLCHDGGASIAGTHGGQRRVNNGCFLCWESFTCVFVFFGLVDLCGLVFGLLKFGVNYVVCCCFCLFKNRHLSLHPSICLFAMYLFFHQSIDHLSIFLSLFSFLSCLSSSISIYISLSISLFVYTGIKSFGLPMTWSLYLYGW